MKLLVLIIASAAALSVAALSKQQANLTSFAPLVEPIGARATDTSGSVNGRARRLCRLLTTLAPELRQMAPVAAQARLLSSLDNLVNKDAVALRQVSIEIEETAIESCPVARAGLLSVLQMNSLRDAVAS